MRTTRLSAEVAAEAFPPSALGALSHGLIREVHEQMSNPV